MGTDENEIDYPIDWNLSPKLQSEEDAETARRKTLLRGWHVIKELAQRKRRDGKPTGVFWVYYVTYYKAKGFDTEECLTMKNKLDADLLANTLNTTKAVPTWMR